MTTSLLGEGAERKHHPREQLPLATSVDREAPERESRRLLARSGSLRSQYAGNANRWTRTNDWMTMIVAFTAAVSTVSVFADNAVTTVTFAIVTAVLSAFTAAFKPAEKASIHRELANACATEQRELESLLRRFGPARRDGHHEIDQDEAADVYEALDQARNHLQQVEERAPMSQVRWECTTDAFDSSPPQSWAEMRRYRRALRRARKQAELRRDLAEQTDRLPWLQPAGWAAGPDPEPRRPPASDGTTPEAGLHSAPDTSVPERGRGGR